MWSVHRYRLIPSFIDRVIGSGDHFHAVDESGDVVAGDYRLHHVTIPDPVLRAGKLPQRREIPDLPVPPHDLGVGVFCLQASPENLVSGAAVWREGAAQANLDFLEILLRLVLAENCRRHMLVLSPHSGDHGGRVVVVSLRRDPRSPGVRGREVSLFYPALGGLHARHRAVGHAVPDHDVGPVNTVRGPVEPNTIFRDRVLITLETRAVRPDRVSSDFHRHLRYPRWSPHPRRSP